MYPYCFATSDVLELERWKKILIAEKIAFTQQWVQASSCKAYYTLCFKVEEYRLPFPFCQMILR